MQKVLQSLQKTTMISRNMQKIPIQTYNFNQIPKISYQPQYNFFKPKDTTVVELPENLKNIKTFEFHKDIPNPVHNLVQPGKEKIIGSWLLLTAGGVFFMIVLGGYTRLSGSGLSMTKWKPIDPKMPQTQEQWEAEFEHYKLFPEYQLQNKDMTVEGFKKIFFVEWLHRAIGSSLGVVFTLPFAYFLTKGHIKAPFRNRLLGLLALGGSQGLIGWWMVRSGMQEKPEYQNKPRVSVYRLLVHLNTALVIYGGLLWNALTLLRKPQEQLLRPESLKGSLKVRLFGILILHCLALNTLSGACVAGIDAGKLFNDWPLFNGQILPPKMFELSPVYKNIFENKGTVQLNHRMFGYLTFAASVLMFVKCRNLNLLKHQRIYMYGLCGIISYQVLNGIVTLLHLCKPAEANAHQLTAILVLTTAILMTHSCRKPSKLYQAYLKQFIL